MWRSYIERVQTAIFERHLSMWKRFSKRTRMVIVCAQQAAFDSGASVVQPEHLLLGIIGEYEQSIASLAIAKLDVDFSLLRAKVEELASEKPREELASGAKMILSPTAKTVIDLAFEEAKRVSSRSIDTGHLLVGLIQESKGIGALALASMGVECDSAQAATVEIRAQTRE